MKPEIALNTKNRIFYGYTKEDVEALRDEWVAAYREIAESEPVKKALCELLTERIRRAAELFLGGVKEPVESLDGDFPLGNETDMKLASFFFSLKELAMMQAGLADLVPPELPETGFPFGRPVTERKYGRKGFLAELKGEREEAMEYYREHCEGSKYPDDYVKMRYDAYKNSAYDERQNFINTSKMLLERSLELKGKDVSLSSLSGEFLQLKFVRRAAESEEDKALVKQCEAQILACCNTALEINYKKIEEYIKRGVTDFVEAAAWTLTFDENGNFARTSVIGIGENGELVYGGNCTAVNVSYEISSIIKKRDSLKERIKECALSPEEEKAWFGGDTDFYKLLAAAESLRQRARLGGDSGPVYNRDLSGLSGGQLDAAAWQNYAIEMGLARPHVNYDELLDELIEKLRKFTELYEKATRTA